MKNLFKMQVQGFKAFIMNLILDYLDKKEKEQMLGILQRDDRFYKMQFVPVSKSEAERIKATNSRNVDGFCLDATHQNKINTPNVEEPVKMIQNLN